MVFSTGVLAVAFLKIPLNGSKFLGLDLGDVEPARVWIATLIVLSYLLLRYWHDPAVRNQFTGWKNHGKTVYRELAKILVQQAFLSRSRKRLWQPVIFDITQPPTPDAQPSANSRFSFISWRKGYVGVGWSGTIEKDDGTRVKVSFVDDGKAWFKIHWMRSSWLVVRAIRRMFRISWTVLEILVPLFLALGAFAVSAGRLVQSLA